MTAESLPTDLIMTLDGETVTFTLGETIYDVAARQGTFIPTLCYDGRLKPFGACRLCVVAVRGQRNPVAACTTPAVIGMEVTTSTEQVDFLRKTLLELVASENPMIDVSPLRSSM